MPPSTRLSLSKVGSSNAVYSDAEEVVIKTALKSAEAAILRLASLRNNTVTQRHRLKDQIHRYHIALAPFNKVPNEIWTYIFELYCQSDRLSTIDTIQPPVVLTQVCSAWRQIALSTPKFWSDVHVGKNIDLAKMWLERAGNIPRALDTSTCICIEPCHRRKYERAQAIWNIIRSFPFRKLHLTESDAAYIDFKKIPDDSLVLLEDLALKRDPPHEYRPWSFIRLPNPDRCPNLLSLDIHINSIYCVRVPGPIAKWKNLRVLRLEGNPTVSDCLEILNEASSVEDYTLHQSRGSLCVAGPIGHTNLKALTLSSLSAVKSWRFLINLTCPNLHTLNCISPLPNISPDQWDAQSMRSLSHHFGSLTSLNIYPFFYMDADISDMLEILPLLQILQFHCGQITMQTRQKIGKGELGGCLRELHDYNSKNLFELIQICELRRKVTQSQPENGSTAIARLEKVSVMRTRPVSCTNQSRIRRLRRDGIDFKVFEECT